MGTARRIRRTVQKQGSLKSAKKQTFLKSVEGWRFPRRTFLKGVGVAALAGLGILAVDYYKDNYALKTWRPGNETWKPVIHTPSEEMDPVDKAIWLVKENICRYSIDDLNRMDLQPVDVYYMVTYQLRVKPITAKHIAFYLDALETEKDPYTNRKKIFFPLALQGHVCQFADALYRAAKQVPDSERIGKSWLAILREGGRPIFKIRGQKTCLRDILMDEVKDFPPSRMGVANEDPSWIMTAYANANPPPESWVDFKMPGDVRQYLLYALETNPETGMPRWTSFACMGTHFPDALSKLYWYYGQHSSKYQDAQDTILKIMGAILPVDSKLEHYSEKLIPNIEKYRDNPTKEQFSGVFNAFVYVVHTLETILEPEGYYRYHYPVEKLEGVINTLAEGINLWYSPELDGKREFIDGWGHYDDAEAKKLIEKLSPSQRRELDGAIRQLERYTALKDAARYSVFMQGRLLQGCHALMLWKEYKQQQAEKSVEGVAAPSQ